MFLPLDWRKIFEGRRPEEAISRSIYTEVHSKAPKPI